MMDEGPGPHDRRLMTEDDGAEEVPCSSCGKAVWVRAERCPHCGVHFAGEAWEFAEAGVRRGSGLPRWAVVTAWVLLLVLILIWGLLLF
jgi:hypothetical protein